MGSLAGGLIGGGLSLIGGIMGGNAQKSAASTSANAQIRAAQIAAEASKFRPVGVTTSFGQSNFQLDDKGNLVSAGYNLNPQLQGLQTSLLGGFGNQLAQAQGVDTSQLQQGAQSLYGLGQGYLSASPEEARQRYISQQQALLAPLQEQELAGLRNRLFTTGRTGLATGGTMAGGMAQTNPELAAYYNSLARSNAALAAGAEGAAQQQTQFGQDLLSGGANLQNLGYGLQTAAYNPLTTALGLGGTVEGFGQQALELGAGLGGRVTAANTTGAGLLANAQTNAARTLQGANQTSPFGTALSGLGSNQQFTNAAGNWFNNIISPTPYSGRGTIYSNTPGSYTEFDY
jgi:hypothetical protein